MRQSYSIDSPKISLGILEFDKEEKKLSSKQSYQLHIFNENLPRNSKQ